MVQSKQSRVSSCQTLSLYENVACTAPLLACKCDCTRTSALILMNTITEHGHLLLRLVLSLVEVWPRTGNGGGSSVSWFVCPHRAFQVSTAISPIRYQPASLGSLCDSSNCFPEAESSGGDVQRETAPDGLDASHFCLSTIVGG